MYSNDRDIRRRRIAMKHSFRSKINILRNFVKKNFETRTVMRNVILFIEKKKKRYTDFEQNLLRITNETN